MRIFREVWIAADEVRNRTAPGTKKRILAKSQCRLEENRALCIVIKRVDQSAGSSTDITAFDIHGANMHQAVAPGPPRGVDHLFGDWA